MSTAEVDASAPGSILAAAREAIGVTRREVAEALNLPVAVVEAIEIGDREKLPAHVFTRGYVRAYAKLLELDPDPLVAALTFDNAQDSEAEPEVENALGPIKLFHLKNEHLKIGIGLLAGILIFVLALIIFSGSDAESTETLPAGLENEVEVDVRRTEGEELADEAGKGENIEVVEAFQMASVGDANTGPLTIGPSSSDQASAHTTQVNLAEPLVSGVRRLTQHGQERLKIKFTEDCWVEIKHSDGRTLVVNWVWPAKV
ncbi:MAG: helix-turn-helix domain-containing protein [Gammaproteobacteria bacterium]|nr:helix-turn-helix domain-containing protein [Gammaproteobacteria bacterium]